VGPARDAPIYEGLGLQLTDTAAHAAFIACTGLFDDEIETPEDYRERLEACARRALPMICANPDRVVQRGDKLIWCAGALAELYVELGGTVTMAGKPHAPIYDLALAEAARIAGKPIDRSRVLCIGDGVPTDIKGANAQGLDVLFIASGIHGEDAVGAGGGLDAARAETLLGDAGTHAAWAMADLAW
jgi:HAD superfamily hydrolase (TIGR01459 family)